MEEHPGRHDHVELAVRERELLNVADPRVDTARARELDHPLGHVDRDDLGSELPLHPLADLARARPDLEERAGAAAAIASHITSRGSGPTRLS